MSLSSPAKAGPVLFTAVCLLSPACETAPEPAPEELSQVQSSLHGTINPTSNTDGRDLATSCAARVTAPMTPQDLAARQTVPPSQVSVTGAQWATQTRLSVPGPVVEITRLPGPNPWYAVGFQVQNGVGSVAPGGPANQAAKAPLLLSITAFAGTTQRGNLRFWTYQGLRPAAGQARFEDTGIPEGFGTSATTEAQPAYMGIALPDVTFDRVRIEVLNPSALTGPWTVQTLSRSSTPASATCWHADPNWHLVTNPVEYQGQVTPEFTHLLRTESHSTHAGHTVGHYWEFNVWADPQTGPASGSVLQTSGAKGNLTSPAIQLRDAEDMCDQLGQRDILGLRHWSHFHFQGYHEGDDAGYGESKRPFDHERFCGIGAPPNPYTRFCEAFACCKAATDYADVETPSEALGTLGHDICGATCVQTMQVERDACLGSPVSVPGGAPLRDQRLSYYSLDNGRTWRRINHANNRYHGGYPGEWHYNHAHPFQDSDGMLGMDHEGFDWDQDGALDASSPDSPAGGDPDRQFGLAVAGQYRSPAMRFRFRYEERGTGPCDPRGDGYCAGWRLDDFGFDYDEECDQEGQRYFDTLGDPTTTFVGAVTEAEVDAVCDATHMARALEGPSSCVEDPGADTECAAEMEATHQHDIYVFDANESPGCDDPFQSCQKQICVESHGAFDACYPYSRACAPDASGRICCDVSEPWEDYCEPE